MNNDTLRGTHYVPIAHPRAAAEVLAHPKEWVSIDSPPFLRRSDAEEFAQAYAKTKGLRTFAAQEEAVIPGLRR